MCFIVPCMGASHFAVWLISPGTRAIRGPAGKMRPQEGFRNLLHGCTNTAPFGMSIIDAWEQVFIFPLFCRDLKMVPRGCRRTVPVGLNVLEPRYSRNPPDVSFVMTS